MPDLLHLLPDRDDQLDHRLYQQSVILHALLRKVGQLPAPTTSVSCPSSQELHSVTQKTPGSGYKSQEYVSTIPYLSDSSSSISSLSSSTSADNFYASSTTSLYSQHLSSYKSSTASMKASPSSAIDSDENIFPGVWNILNSEDFHVYAILCILLLLLFLFFIILFAIIFRCKSSFQKRPISKGKISN